MGKATFEPKKSFDTIEEGTRFIYRRNYSSMLREDTLDERSPSGDYLKFRCLGWTPSRDISIHYTLVEVLGESKVDDGMCPNCATPWKCNGRHIKPCRGAPGGSPELERYLDELGI